MKRFSWTAISAPAIFPTSLFLGKQVVIQRKKKKKQKTPNTVIQITAKLEATGKCTEHAALPQNKWHIVFQNTDLSSSLCYLNKDSIVLAEL